VSRFLTAHHHN